MDYTTMSIKELKTLAKVNKIKGRSTLKKKHDLIEALDRKDSKLEKKTTDSLLKTVECPIITEKTSIDKTSVKLLFFSKCDDKGKNDEYNKLREEVLESLLDGKYDSYFTDEEYGTYWKNLKQQWTEVLTKIYDKSYDSIKIKQKGGRAFNYDFDVSYLKDGKIIDTLKVEFKCGGKIIEEIPQFFNADANKSFLPGYASWFYDNYVSKKAPWTQFEAPTKEVYMKEIYKNASKVEYFKKLYDAEKSDKEFYKLKSDGTKESIAVWLEENHTKLDLEELSKEFIRSQAEKIYILWDKDTFHTDKFDANELVVKKVVGIKNKNTILVDSKNDKIQYAMLLRWKNHLGVLLPAWQISMKRINQ